MKILYVNVVYGYGSTGKIVKSLFEKTSLKHETYLIYGRGKKLYQKNIFKPTIELESKIHHFFSKFTGNIYGGMHFSTMRTISRIKKINPDIVNLHCLNGYFVNIYKLLKWLAKNNIKTVLTMHADFMMTGGCGVAANCEKYINLECKNCKKVKQFNGIFSLKRTNYFYKKLLKCISKFNNDSFIGTCVSNWLQLRYSKSPIYRGKIFKTVLNPIDDLFFKKGNINPYQQGKNILFVTPDIFDPTKGSCFIDEIAQRRKDLNFTVICSKNQEFKFKNNNVVYIKCGVSQEKLRDYYYFADATLLLSSSETFSMVTAESLACGTPVYGFKCGGPESFLLNRDSKFFNYNDFDGLASSLLTIKNNKEIISKNAYNLFNSEVVCNQYLKVFSTFFH